MRNNNPTPEINYGDVIYMLSFESLTPGDQVVLNPDSKYVYIFDILLAPEGQSNFAKLTLAKPASRYESDKLIEADTPVELLGSCDGFVRAGDDFFVSEPEPDIFKVGKRGWYKVLDGDIYKDTTTSIIEGIKLMQGHSAIDSSS